MKNKNIIMASLLVFAMLASMMPLYDASAPAIEANAIDTNILIGQYNISGYDRYDII